MVAPLSWPTMQRLLDSNVVARFRIKEADPKRRDGVIRQFTSQTMGRWGFCVVGDSLILAVEDPEDITLVKKSFYKSWKRK